ncbi:MAG: alanine racemase [Deltaproteobacteria bacterium]|nr:alanine racemase [Deltaproteobacteria bacterium]
MDSFTANWDEMKRLVGAGVRFMQVVKADAYGHGAIEISNVALRNGAVMLGVANADEGAQLRVGGITAPILILSPSTGDEIAEIIKYHLIPSVSDLSFARELQKQCTQGDIRMPIHIEVDTGMGRGGTMHSEALQMIREISGFSHLISEGIFTHFSQSEVSVTYNEIQGKLFRNILKELDAAKISIPVKHLSNSGAILNLPHFHMDMVRPGLMSYGIYPSPETEGKARLLPVMTFKTRVILIKEFPEGYGIGYGRTYITEKPTRIATLPVGYGDGYGFVLSNQGEVLIRGQRAPIVGRISMDMCTVDVTGIGDCRIGDEVVMMGRQGNEYLSAADIARREGTISYEVLCALGKRAPRIFVQKGKTGAVEPRLRRIFIPDEEKSVSRLDSIIRSCFQTRVQSVEMGDAIYYEMFDTLFGREDRELELRSDFKYDINVTGLPEEGRGAERAANADFTVTTRIEYVKTMKNPLFMIGCARDNAQLAAFFEDNHCEYRWLLNHGNGPVGEKDFRVTRVLLDDVEVPFVRAENTKRGYEVWYGGDFLRDRVGSRIKLTIEIITRQARANNVFSVYLVYPTRGLDISFNYEGTGFRDVRDVHFFAGRHPYPDVSREKGKSVRLKIADNVWIFPNSGVTFIGEK